MRPATLTALLIAGSAGCLDLSALQTSEPDMAMQIEPDMRPSTVDMAPITDLKPSPDQSPPGDMNTGPYWTDVTPAGGVAPLNAVSGYASGGQSTMYAVGNAVGTAQTVVKKSTTGLFSKLATSITSNSNLSALWVKDATNVWIVDDSMKTYQSTDGLVFVDKGNATGAPATHGIFGHALNSIIAVGDDAMMASFFVTDWNAFPHGLNAKLHGVWASANNYFVVGEGGQSGHIGVTTPNMAFTAYTKPTGNSNFNCVFGSDDSNIWAGTDAGQIMITTSAATMWTELTKVGGGASPVIAIWGSAGNDIWAVSAAGKIYQWNGALNDRTDNLSPSFKPKGIWGDGGGSIWLVGATGSNGLIFKH